MKTALLLCSLAAILGLSLVAPVAAQDRVTLGLGRIFANDAIGDGRDRWRSGGYALSLMRGPGWDGQLPGRAGEILEFRLRSEVIAPEDLVNPDPDDRRYVGALSLGVHTHFALGAAEVSAGGDLVFTGPQTGIGAFQRNIHNLLGLPKPRVLGDQIPDQVFPTVSAEIGRSVRLNDRVTLRPFAQAQAGVESLVRVGGDMVVGQFGAGGLMIRDVITGQRVEGIEGADVPGLSFTLGGDVAHVFDSGYLPDGGLATLNDTRTRLRAGVHWQGETSEAFYGVTLLGKEFEEQPDPQLVGSLSLRLRF
ncbi:DUF2219 family protein [Paracoccaceae bacterium Fryx2]|nr:DUF2219 family protein [Paracoccaceae bacterium Fryx2]